MNRFDDWKQPEIKHNVMTRWGWMVACPENLDLGRNTDLGCGVYIGAHKGVNIGENCQIGAHCAIYSLSTIDNKEGEVTLEKGSCVGAGSVVMPGVHIGEGAIVGALSFVRYGTRIPANETWVGIPANNIGDV